MTDHSLMCDLGPVATEGDFCARAVFNDPPAPTDDSRFWATIMSDAAAIGIVLSPALNTIRDGIWVFDAEGDIVFRNPAASELERYLWFGDEACGTFRELMSAAELRVRLRQLGRHATDFELIADDMLTLPSIRVELQVSNLLNDNGDSIGTACHARDITREWHREQALQDRHVELQHAHEQLKQAQLQLLQSEKLASIGQLAAGVAHEINNPIGYVQSNLGTLSEYTGKLMALLEACEILDEGAHPELDGGATDAVASALNRIRTLKRSTDLRYLKEDLPALIAETREGVARVRKIVADLRDFSHGGQIQNEDWVQADLHLGLESTLNIVWSELKYKADIVRNYGRLPAVECMPAHLNQVFMNLLLNAAQAIEKHGRIEIATESDDREVRIRISDSGTGIKPEHLKRIFDPFFTTKPVGTGTGLGLSLSYSIVQKHHGRISVTSEPGQGSVFTVHLPIAREKIEPLTSGDGN